MMSVPKKQIRFRPVSQKFFPKQRFHFPQMSISLSTANSFGVFINTPERFEITTYTKTEWVLDAATVMYGSASELSATLEYDFSQEKDFSYKGTFNGRDYPSSCGIHFKIMANSYFQGGRQYENNGSVLHQIFKDTWFFCYQ